MRRVVVTGLGLVTPLGVGIDFVWDNLIKGKSGISQINSFDTEDLPVKIAAQIPRGDAIGHYNPDNWLDSNYRKL